MISQTLRPTGGITAGIRHPCDPPHDVRHDMHQEKITGKF